MSAGDLSNKDPPDIQGEGLDNKGDTDGDASITVVTEETSEATEATEESSEETTKETPTYAAALTSSGDKDKIVDILRIVFKKTKPGANYYLKDKEKAKLVFMMLGIPRENVVGIDREDFRTIRVHMNCASAPWKIAHSVEIKDGLITLPMRMFRRYTKVTVMNAGVESDPGEITEMLGHFGHFGDYIQIKECTYFENADLSKLTLEERMMRGIKNGDFEIQMFITKNIPSFAMLKTGKRVRVRYPAQPATCGRCMQGIRGCKGGANAARCEKKGGEKIDFENYWKLLIAPSERPVTEGQQEICEGGEEAIPNTILRIEGLGKKAGTEWVKTLLSTCVSRTLEDKELKQSENKLAWEVSSLSPDEIQKILQTVSGTQFKGKTVYCVPIVVNVENVNDPPSPPSEAGTADMETDQRQEEVPEAPETPEKKSEGEDSDSDSSEDFAKVERKRKSAEKKARKKEAKEKEAAEKLAESEQQKDLVPVKSPGKGNASKVNNRKRQLKVTPDKPESGPATRYKRGKQQPPAADPPPQQ